MMLYLYENSLYNNIFSLTQIIRITKLDYILHDIVTYVTFE
jgi:hypothetical protein